MCSKFVTQKIVVCRIRLLNTALSIYLFMSCWTTESPVKRKRGRPKGSTKKTCTDQQEGKVVSIHPPEKKVRRDDERNKEEVDRKGKSLEGW